MFLVAGGALGWLWKIFASFWFWLDTSIFSLIGNLYDILMMISRTTILSQNTINSVKMRVQLFLGVFMLFKVGLSLIMYVVNPDDFSDQSKGIGKLVMNTVISLLLLVTVPYIFNIAFRVQAIILEENVLAHLVFGNNYTSSNGKTNYTYDVLSGGEKMKYELMMPFFQPNTGLQGAGLEVCTQLDQNGNLTEKCKSKLESLVSDGDKINVMNYIAGVEHKSFGLTFRLSTVTVKIDSGGDDADYVFDYKWPLTTVAGVITCLLLINYCIDIAVRSIKLAFLQLIAPIPIISYMDPKGGKDGMFGKWAKMCMSTYLSLFIRLLALFFGIFIISNLGQITDVISGTTVTHPVVNIFVIIGVLFFIKQLPKILQDMGIKLDGDGKFNLNPLKRAEENALGGKRITGAAAGFAVGALGNKGNPFKAVGGMLRGAAGNQGLSGAAKHQADVNKQLRQAKLDGSTLFGRMNARWGNLTGAKGFNNVEKDRKKMDALKESSDAINAMEDRAVSKIKSGEAGSLSREYLARDNRLKAMQTAFSEGKKTFTDSQGRTFALNEESIAYQQMAVNDYLNNEAKYAYMDAMLHGKYDESTNSISYKDKNGNTQTISDLGVDKTFKSQEDTWRSKTKEASGAQAPQYAEDIHGEMGRQKGEITKLDNETRAKAKSNEANQKYVEAAKIKK